ncbi:MAG TPA: hypothetical protein VMZ53_33365 [Kofleriaceae bacterium]|nr:hypothetical protein [Kofleriaceae bacterium]
MPPPGTTLCVTCGRNLAFSGYPQQPAMAPYGGSYIYPSRGSTILVLGILSLVVCSILGPIAWSMGNEEQRRIAAGQAPPDGNVSAGRICGMISSILLILGGCFILFALAIAPR